jgi:hypothetical protein
MRLSASARAEERTSLFFDDIPAEKDGGVRKIDWLNRTARDGRPCLETAGILLRSYFFLRPSYLPHR